MKLKKIVCQETLSSSKRDHWKKTYVISNMHCKKYTFWLKWKAVLISWIPNNFLLINIYNVQINRLSFLWAVPNLYVKFRYIWKVCLAFVNSLRRRIFQHYPADIANTNKVEWKNFNYNFYAALSQMYYVVRSRYLVSGL